MPVQNHVDTGTSQKMVDKRGAKSDGIHAYFFYIYYAFSINFLKPSMSQHMSYLNTMSFKNDVVTDALQ